MPEVAVGGLHDPKVVMYLIYVALSAALTVWVARTLHKNGRVFLVDVFRGNQMLADSVNHLLAVGFYLVNLGYVSLALRTRDGVADTQGVIEMLSWKVGLVLVVLGAMHFTNLVIFTTIRRRATLGIAPHPVQPDERLTPPDATLPPALPATAA